MSGVRQVRQVELSEEGAVEGRVKQKAFQKNEMKAMTIWRLLLWKQAPFLLGKRYQTCYNCSYNQSCAQNKGNSLETGRID